ncbi:MAG: biotin--[acetyl-CoA-carboxylase] ligase, partial [Maribacter arcticus]
TFENELYKKYHSQLFKIGVKSTFIIKKEELIEGVIEGVSKNGKLKVQIENGSLQEFGLKEIQLQY